MIKFRLKLFAQDQQAQQARAQQSQAALQRTQMVRQGNMQTQQMIQQRQMMNMQKMQQNMAIQKAKLQVRQSELNSRRDKELTKNITKVKLAEQKKNTEGAKNIQLFKQKAKTVPPVSMDS